MEAQLRQPVPNDLPQASDEGLRVGPELQVRRQRHLRHTGSAVLLPHIVRDRLRPGVSVAASPLFEEEERRARPLEVGRPSREHAGAAQQRDGMRGGVGDLRPERSDARLLERGERRRLPLRRRQGVDVAADLRVQLVLDVDLPLGRRDAEAGVLVAEALRACSRPFGPFV